MKGLNKILSLILLPVACSYATNNLNAEGKALAKCNQYNELASTLQRDNIKNYDCSTNTHSDEQWECIITHIKSDKQNFDRASQLCFTQAPALSYFMQFEDQLSTIPAEVICKQAVITFQNYHPDNLELNDIYSSCPTTKRTTVMWSCMQFFAADRDSFAFSKAQCFLEETNSALSESIIKNLNKE